VYPDTFTNGLARSASETARHDRRNSRLPGPIEVVMTTGGVEKLRVDEDLGGREVWFFKNGRFAIHELAASGGYSERSRSVFFPDIDFDQLATYVVMPIKTMPSWPTEVSYAQASNRRPPVRSYPFLGSRPDSGRGRLPTSILIRSGAPLAIAEILCPRR
jgi:hypothetical protein